MTWPVMLRARSCACDYNPRDGIFTLSHRVVVSETVRAKTGAYHLALEAALAPLAGKTITLADARSALLERNPALRSEIEGVFLSDHCDNHVPTGGCICAGTRVALVERLGHNSYRVR